MKKYALTAFFAIVLSGCVAPDNLKAAIMTDTQTQKIDAAINSYIARKQMPGAAYLLHQATCGASGKAETRVRAYGKLNYAEDALNTGISTVFDAASLTKAVATAPSVLRLVEMGKLALDAPVAQYLPDCFPAANRTGAQAITVRHLLTHSSSLPAGLSASLDYSGDARGKVFMHACAQAPTHAPGKFFRYSDINFILLGRLVEVVSGISLDAFATTHIFAPLNMQHTRFTPLQGARPLLKNTIAPTQIGGSKPLDSVTRLHTDLAEGEILQGVVHDPTSRIMGGVSGHAGLFTTVDDLSRYARMVLNGGSLDGVRVLSFGSVALMHTAQTQPDVVSVSMPAVGNIKRTAGWDMQSPYSRPRGTLNEEGQSNGFSFASFGHTGFTGCILWIDPIAKRFYVFLSNRVYPDDSQNVLALYNQLGDLSAEVVIE